MVEREYDLDILRVAGSFAVVWLHVSGGVLVDTSRGMDFSWWVGNLANAMSYWCVPVFVMVSGALLLSRPLVDNPVVILKHRLARLAVPLVIWTVFYTLLAWVSSHGVIDFRSTLKGILRGMPVTGFHLWYLYMCVGLYTLAPLVCIFIEAVPRNMVKYTLLIGFLMASIEGVVSLSCGTPVASTFLGLCVPYTPYFIAGVLLRRLHINSGRTRLLLLAAVSCGVLIAVGTAALLPVMNKPWAVLHGYLNPLVIVMAICVYMVVTQEPASRMCNNRMFQKLVRYVAPFTLGVYVLHPFCLQVLSRLEINAWFGTPIIGIPVTTILAFSLSVALGRIIGMLPFIRRSVM